MREIRASFIIALFGLVMLGSMTLYLSSRPRWQLTVSNSANGLTVTIGTTASPTPVYTVLINGSSIQTPITTADRENLDSSEVTTLHYDATAPPGRWTVDVKGTKLDILEHKIIINDQIQGVPAQVLEVN